MPRNSLASHRLVDSLALNFVGELGCLVPALLELICAPQGEICGSVRSQQDNTLQNILIGILGAVGCEDELARKIHDGAKIARP